MSQNIKNDKIPSIYGVYLLNSLNKKNAYYVGSTPHPLRRLRQHNGELSVGGAYKTKKKGYRPWKLILFVYGFPSKISALQFEHAWQHSYQTRHIPFEKRLNPGKRSTGSGSSIAQKLANCKLLLSSDSFKMLGLKVAVFTKSVYDGWLSNKLGVVVSDDIRLNIRVSSENVDDKIIPGGNYEQIKLFMDEEIKWQDNYVEKSLDTYKDSINKDCMVCQKKLDQEALICFCVHNNCNSMYHIKCWYDSIIETEKKKECEEEAGNEALIPLLPIKGKCVKCNKMNFWNSIVRNSLNVNEKLKEKSQV